MPLYSEYLFYYFPKNYLSLIIASSCRCMLKRNQNCINQIVMIKNGSQNKYPNRQTHLGGRDSNILV
jgi:hypothetical protein